MIGVSVSTIFSAKKRLTRALSCIFLNKRNSPDNQSGSRLGTPACKVSSASSIDYMSFFDDSWAKASDIYSISIGLSCGRMLSQTPLSADASLRSPVSKIDYFLLFSPQAFTDQICEFTLLQSPPVLTIGGSRTAT